jgi:membrane-associated progesterone receptor component
MSSITVPAWIPQYFSNTPLNVVLAGFLGYLTYSLFVPSPEAASDTIPDSFESSYNWKPKSHPPTILFKKYSPNTLEPFSGKDGGRILLAIDRKVFDVTAGRSFYGPGSYLFHYSRILFSDFPVDGMYGNFAGRDASRGMAKQSFDLGGSLQPE